MDPNVFETANAGFAQAMYEEFLRDPAAVGPEWRHLFESGVVGEAGKRVSGEAGKQVGERPRQEAPQKGQTAAAQSTDPPTRLPAIGREPDKGSCRQARGEHERESHGAHGNDVP